MRRIALLTALVLLSVPATAAAVTNVVGYDARIAMSALPLPAAPANLAYEFVNQARTSPGGNQPDGITAITVYFASAISANGAYWPSCTQAEIDGQAALPSHCSPAVVGTGEAVIHAGSPGNPIGDSVREDLSVQVVNGPGGNTLLLVVSSAPAAPVVISHRVIPGTVVPASSPYGFAARFDVPADLQSQLGLTLTLTDLAVNINQHTRTLDIGGTPALASYLRISDCAVSIPVQSLTRFSPSVGSPVDVISTSSASCAIGTGFPDYPVFEPATYPGYPPTDYPPQDKGGDGTPGGGGGGGSSPGDGGTPDGAGPSASDSSSSTPPPRTPPAPPRISSPSGLGTVEVGPDGAFTLKNVQVACPSNATGGCTVDGDATSSAAASKVRKPIVLARVHFRLAAGKASGVRMRLTAAGKKQLARKRLLKLIVHLRVADARGVKTAKTLKATLKPAKQKRSKRG